MKLITEVVETVKVIQEANEEGKKTLFIEGIFLQGNIKNRNGRMYKTETLKKAVDNYMAESVMKGRAYGELGHPDGPTINLDRVSHLITDLRQEGDNFIGKAKISSTPMGKIVEGLLSDGAQLGVSSRGLGSLKERNGIMEVQDDFFLATAADIVADPSAPAAFVNGIMEGVEYWFDNGSIKGEQVAEQIEQEIEASVRGGKLDEQKQLQLFQRYLEIISNN